MFFLPVDEAERTLKAITAEFAQGIAGFYNDTHKKQGYILSTDREGKVCRYPLMSIIAAAALVEKQCSFDYISSSLASMKERLKKESKEQGISVYGFDKRKIFHNKE